MAREHKADIEKLLLDIKKKVTDLRYIIRNGHNDVQVLLKPGFMGEYRWYPVKKLGSIALLNPTQKNQILSSPSKFKQTKYSFSKGPP